MLPVFKWLVLLWWASPISEGTMFAAALGISFKALGFQECAMTNTGYTLLFNTGDPAGQVEAFIAWFAHKIKMATQRMKIE